MNLHEEFMNHSESNLNKLFNQCYILVPDLDSSLSKRLFWPRPLLFWSIKLAVSPYVVIVCPSLCIMSQKGPMQGPCDAAFIPSVGQDPSSQRPYRVACTAALSVQ